MIKIKKILKYLGAITLIGTTVLFAWAGAEYAIFRGTARAVGGLPWQDGGRITLVREPCVLDTPATSPVTCAISCPLVTSVLGQGCVGYIEIDTVGQLGTTFIAAPVGFIYKGGGTHPVAGMQFIAGGSSPVMPWVIGIPGPIAFKTQKTINVLRFIIAGLGGN